jgi:hypothetical protein
MRHEDRRPRMAVMGVKLLAGQEAWSMLLNKLRQMCLQFHQALRQWEATRETYHARLNEARRAGSGRRTEHSETGSLEPGVDSQHALQPIRVAVDPRRQR